MAKREHVRQVRTTSLAAKRFKRVIDSGYRAELPTTHPEIVAQDLRRGCLSSLDRYLALHQGVPDRRVALELRKLITGSRHRTDYRLIVVDHPKKPKNKGGRSRVQLPRLSAREVAILKLFDEVRPREGKNELTRTVVADELKISDRTVSRALAKRRQIQKKKQRAQSSKQSRAAALSAYSVRPEVLSSDTDKEPGQVS